MNIPPPITTTLDLSATSLKEKQKHEAILLDLEARKLSHSIVVPTLAADVQRELRKLGEPIRLFGESLADIRSRLRLTLAKLQLLQKQLSDLEGAVRGEEDEASSEEEEEEEAPKLQKKVQQEVQYTHADPELVQARQRIADYSLPRAQKRIKFERKIIQRIQEIGRNDDSDEADSMEDENQTYINSINEATSNLYEQMKGVSLEGSQYGDNRCLSCICTLPANNKNNSIIQQYIATGSWSGSVALYNPLSLDKVWNQVVHEDRIMGVDSTEYNGATFVATSSIDKMAKLFKLENNNDDDKLSLAECMTFSGHAARLCKVAFHPTGQFVATTSFDTTWRLWDIETSKELLLQDGHAKETYGIGMHKDGSLVSTTDFGGVVLVWDLRSGKAITTFSGQHAKRVLCSQFHPNGYQLATAGDDGTIKVFDLRRCNPKKTSSSMSTRPGAALNTQALVSNIPAHSSLISQIQFGPAIGDNNETTGETLSSCSFDGTIKLWSTRNYSQLNKLEGHEGKVMGIDTLVMNEQNKTKGVIVSCGYDKTMKIWKSSSQ